jgi:hypothetical protein
MTAVGTADDLSTGRPNSTLGSMVTTRGCARSSAAPATAGERVQAGYQPVLVPFDTLRAQADQVAHRELSVPGRVNHILETRRFNEEMLAIREHLVMHKGVASLKLLTEIVDGAPNLRQFDVIRPS